MVVVVGVVVEVVRKWEGYDHKGRLSSASLPHLPMRWWESLVSSCSSLSDYCCDHRRLMGHWGSSEPHHGGGCCDDSELPIPQRLHSAVKVSMPDSWWGVGNDGNQCQQIAWGKGTVCPWGLWNCDDCTKQPPRLHHPVHCQGDHAPFCVSFGAPDRLCRRRGRPIGQWWRGSPPQCAGSCKYPQLDLKNEVHISICEAEQHPEYDIGWTKEASYIVRCPSDKSHWIFWI